MTDLFPNLKPPTKPAEGIWDAHKTPTFDGAEIDEEKDTARLTGQIKRVWDVLHDSRFPTWWTVEEINVAIRARTNVYDPECSISAQIRNLRKKKFGGHVIERRRRGGENSPLWEFQLQQKGEL